MTRYLMFGLIAFLYLFLFRRKSEAAEPPVADKIHEALQVCVEKQHRSPAIVAGLIDKNGVTIFARGRREDDKPGEVNGDTIFEIGSVTKVFTTLLLQDMADHGELGLDDPLTHFLPASVTVPSRNGLSITLRHLATHTSGLPRLPDNLAIKDQSNPYANYSVEQMYQFLSNYKLTRDVGAKSDYSNFGMGLLGHILALKAATNFETLVVQRLCEPLNMGSTRITLTPELQARYAGGHDASGAPVGNWDLPTLAGAGALRSSANDLLKLLAAEMGLTPSTLSGAMEKTQAPQVRSGLLNKVGLGWQINVVDDYLWHNGGTGGYRSFIGFTKDRSLGVVVLANACNDVDDIGQFILGKRGSVADFSAPKKRIEVKIDASLYDQYAGQYKLGVGQGVAFSVTRRDNRLFVQLTGQEALEIFPESRTNFFYKAVDAQITFGTNETGAVTHLILHQNGRDQTAKRIGTDQAQPSD